MYLKGTMRDERDREAWGGRKKLEEEEEKEEKYSGFASII